MSKKELGLYELVMLVKPTTFDEGIREKIDFYRDFIKNKGLLAVPAAGSLGLLGYMKGNEDERGGSLY